MLTTHFLYHHAPYNCTGSDQCWGGWEGPHSPSALQKKAISCQTLPDPQDPQGSLTENLRSGPATAVSRSRRWEDVPKALGVRACNTRCNFWPSILPCKSFLRKYIIISVYQAVFSPVLHNGKN